MADVITRFKLETTQFDSKLRDASKNIASLTNHLSLAGKDFDRFAKNNVEAAKSLGSIQSGATNLKDKLKDLVGAFNDAARAYNTLTKEQQNTDYGNALAGSLQELSGRIRETKSELYGAGSAFDGLKDKFTINIDAMKLFNVGVSVVQTALGVAKDAFLSSEGNIDEWGMTVKGAEAAYDTFLNALNTGNWTNFFNNLQTAIQGGRDLYDALDRLDSVKANNEAAIALVEAEIQRLRVSKQQGKDVDDKIKDATQRLKQLRGEAVTAGANAGRTQLLTTLRGKVNSYNTTGVNVSDAQLAAARRRMLKEGQSYFDGMAKVVRQYESNTKYQTTRSTYTQTGLTIGGSKAVEVTGFDLSKLNQQQQQHYLIAKAITEGESKLKEGISTFANAVREGASASREEFRNNRYALQGAGGGGGGKNTPKEKELSIQQQIAELEKEAYTATDERRAEIAVTVQELDKELERQKKIREEIHGIVQETKEAAMATGFSPDGSQNTFNAWLSDRQKALSATQIGSLDWQSISQNIVDTKSLNTLLNEAIKRDVSISPDTVETLMTSLFEGDVITGELQTLVDTINSTLEEGVKPIKINFDTGALTTITETTKEISKGWDIAAKSAKLFGSAMGAIENPSAKVASIIAETVASIAMAYAQTLAKDKTSKSNIFSFIAASTAAMISMTTSIAAVKKATAGSYADGGVIPGNSYSGDNQWAQVNAGEVILTRAQAGSLASQLESSEGSSQPHNSYISGEQIVTVVNAYGRRTGRGEILR